MAAVHHGAKHGVVAAEQRPRLHKISRPHGFPNARAAHHLPVDAHFRNAIDRKPERFAEIRQSMNVSLAAPAETPGVTHGNQAQRVTRTDQRIHEFAGRNLRHLAIKREHERPGHAE